MSNHEIKTIVAELQSMSPRTQLEIVRLCKRVAELTPSYIEQLSQEDYAEFVSLVNQLRAELQAEIDTTNANLTDATESLQAAIDAINSSIRNITFDTEGNKTQITGRLKTSIIETNRIIDEDSQILFGTNQGLVLKQGNHVLNLDDGGLLWLDGIQIQPVPPTPSISLYQHNIYLLVTNSSVKIRLTFNIISENSNALNLADLINTLKDFTWDKPYTASGAYFIISNNISEIILGVSKISNTELGITFFSTSLGNIDNYSIANATIYDNVVEI